MPTTVANEKIRTANDVPATVVLNRVCSGSCKPPHLSYDHAAYSPQPQKTRPVIETAITSKGATEARLLGKRRAETLGGVLIPFRVGLGQKSTRVSEAAPHARTTAVPHLPKVR